MFAAAAVSLAAALPGRLAVARDASTGSDAIGQHLAALAVWGGGPWQPPNPEGGHALWLFALPQVLLADSLAGMFALRAVQAALIAPVAALAAAAFAPRRPAQAALGAGLVVAADPGLLDTLGVAFRGYGAPELAAASALGLGLAVHRRSSGPAIAVLSALAALGQHPMAAGLLLGVVAGLVVVRAPRRPVVLAVALGALAMIPRGWTLVQQAGCGGPALDCLGAVARSSSEPGVGAWGLLIRALHDRILVDFGGQLGPTWLGLAIGAALASAARRARPALSLAVGGLMGVLALGLAVDSLRPYHLRALSGPAAVAAASGLARVPWAAPVWGLASVAWPAPVPLPVDPGGPARADALAARISDLPAPLRVDAAFFDGPVGLEPAPVVLAAIVAGQPPARFQAVGPAGVVLLCSGEPTQPPGPTLATLASRDSGPPGRALYFANRAAASAWLHAHPVPPALVGGALDWVKAVHPRAPAVEDLRTPDGGG